MVELRRRMGEKSPCTSCEPARLETSTPRVYGQMSAIMMPVRAESAPDLSPAWTAAPTATASSGWTPRRGSFPKRSATTLIVAGAIASRDYQEVHHDYQTARKRGTPDIIMNILTTNGFVGRFVTDGQMILQGPIRPLPFDAQAFIGLFPL